RQRPSLANDPAPHRRSPTFVQERADLAHREIAESQMLERAAAAQQLAGEQDAEDAQQTTARRRRGADRPRRRYQQRETEPRRLADVPVLERQHLAPQPARDQSRLGAGAVE